MRNYVQLKSMKKSNILIFIDSFKYEQFTNWSYLNEFVEINIFLSWILVQFQDH